MSAQSHCLAASITCDGDFAEDQPIKIMSIEVLKKDKVTINLLDEHTKYLNPTQLSCHVSRANENKIFTSLKWNKGEIQYNSYDPMFSFISFGSHDEDNHPIKDQTVFIYTQSASETEYQKLATITISPRETVSRFFMLRYTHPFNKIEPQNIILIWNDPSSSDNNSTVNILGFKYTYPLNSTKH